MRAYKVRSFFVRADGKHCRPNSVVCVHSKNEDDAFVAAHGACVTSLPFDGWPDDDAADISPVPIPTPTAEEGDAPPKRPTAKKSTPKKQARRRANDDTPSDGDEG